MSNEPPATGSSVLTWCHDAVIVGGKCWQCGAPVDERGYPTPDRAAAMFPAHACGLYLRHNAHRDTYEPIQGWIKLTEELMDGPEGLWRDAESRQRAIDTDEVWELQWYPSTPVGFNIVLAPTLDEALAFAQESK